MSGTALGWIARIGLVALLAVSQASQDPWIQRPTDVSIVMSTSRGKYDGSYTLSLPSSICGEVPKDRNFSGVAAFIVQFPYPDPLDHDISDVTFNSKVLVGGVTTTDKFYLSVSVQSPTIGRPAAYVLDTLQPKMTGTASLKTLSPGTVQLKVDGVNDRGETVNLTLVCKPKPAATPNANVVARAEF